MAWHSMVQHDVAWHGMAWHGAEWLGRGVAHGMAWHGVTWHVDMVLIYLVAGGGASETELAKRRQVRWRQDGALR